MTSKYSDLSKLHVGKPLLVWLVFCLKLQILSLYDYVVPRKLSIFRLVRFHCRFVQLFNIELLNLKFFDFLSVRFLLFQVLLI